MPGGAPSMPGMDMGMNGMPGGCYAWNGYGYDASRRNAWNAWWSYARDE